MNTNKLKNRLTNPLFFFSTLVLTACSKTAGHLGMENNQENRAKCSYGANSPEGTDSQFNKSEDWYAKHATSLDEKGAKLEDMLNDTHDVMNDTQYIHDYCKPDMNHIISNIDEQRQSIKACIEGFEIPAYAKSNWKKRWCDPLEKIKDVLQKVIDNLDDDLNNIESQYKLAKAAELKELKQSADEMDAVIRGNEKLGKHVAEKNKEGYDKLYGTLYTHQSRIIADNVLDPLRRLIKKIGEQRELCVKCGDTKCAKLVRQYELGGMAGSPLLPGPRPRCIGDCKIKIPSTPQINEHEQRDEHKDEASFMTSSMASEASECDLKFN